MQWGPRQQFLKDKEAEDGVTPQALLSKPDDSAPIIQELLQSFWVLHDMRQDGFNGPGKITLPDIQAFVELFGLPSIDMDLFVRTIRKMDLAYRAAKPE